MKIQRKTNPTFKPGVFLLENLTSGMYNEPLSIYREYIQNAVDSIDLINKNKKLSSRKVTIDLFPFEKKIIIKDNGMGISANNAEEILNSIGISYKIGNQLRGFRGIGRLGGIAFCDKAIFKTKFQGEVIESIQEWDCNELRKYISGAQKNKVTLGQLFKKVITFSQNNGKKTKESYFEVSLEGVNSFRNHIFDIVKVKKYLSQISPVPFSEEFSFGNEIDAFLKEHIPIYGSYNIFLNGEPIYKPYQNTVKLTKDKSNHLDSIDKIKYFKIPGAEEPALAYGWYGERRNLLGAIRKGEITSGIRVRAGNLLIGDDHLLDQCFRETRFNSYVIGEIHIISSELIPNSRRDDFIDNQVKTKFYNSIEKDIGLPISKEIRSRSRLNNNFPNSHTINTGFLKQQALLHDNAIRLMDKVANCCNNCSKLSLLEEIITSS